ncbi:malto-oligosyltrehalose synthase [candidate division KSB1 bacterium]|nr:malto-oligosyltrehalose synthase [candidate division KSB1 bacterium]
MSDSIRASYRIQFNPSFRFRDVAPIIDYLSELGISHLYASPIFKSTPESTHGYDVVDPNAINPALGNKKELKQLIAELKRANIGWIQDIVPNHMAFHSDNHLLMDVLEKGEGSEYAEFFDFNWDHQNPALQDRLLAPFLGEFYGICLERGEIRLTYDHKGLFAAYYDHRFPIRPETYDRVFAYRCDELEEKLGTRHTDYVKLLGALYAIKNSKRSKSEKSDQVAFIKTILWELYQNNKTIRAFFRKNIALFNGKRGDPRSFDRLDDLLMQQNFRLAFYKVGMEEINYRRFFNINGLISVKVENKTVFEQTHKLIAELVDKKRIQGLRIDHVDGLYDPTVYLRQLRQRFNDTYIIVEKILDFEGLPDFWPVDGTTGYEFLNIVNRLLCDPGSEAKLSRFYEKLRKSDQPLNELVHDKKRLIIGKHMAGDIDNLAHLLAGISNKTRYGRDFTLYGLRRALVEVLSWFPVYRTYITEQEKRETDKQIIQQTIDKSIQIMPDFEHEFLFIRNILLLDTTKTTDDEEKALSLRFIKRFQQLSGPLMAKGFEDTALYIYHKLISLNEVGGNPDHYALPVRTFHAFNRQRARTHPQSMNASSTHDTKRGEDIRARINVISELANEWQTKVRQWRKLNKSRKIRKGKRLIPDANDEYFIYQTLAGSWTKNNDIYRKRIKDYMTKAIREAKVHTAWLEPVSDYEKGVQQFIDTILHPTDDNAFLASFLPFQAKIAWYGRFTSYTQTLLKITSPGIPDFYQGSELWDLNLVDPDNRRPVDYERRKTLLIDLKKREADNSDALRADLLLNGESAKFYIIYKALQLGRDWPGFFNQAGYRAIRSGGRYAKNIVAFRRRLGAREIIVVVPRLLSAVTDDKTLPLGKDIWRDTHIRLPADMICKNQFTGEMIQTDSKTLVGRILNQWPVALLVSQEK